MGASLAAEMLKMRKRPATWVLWTVWLGLSLLFGYVLPYIIYLVISNTPEAAPRASPQELLSTTLPAQLVSTSVGGFPLFGGAIAMILGVLVAGSEYGWGTLKMVFTQGPRRHAVLSGKLLALILVLLAFVLAVFIPGALASYIIALLAKAAVDWPSVLDVAKGIGAAWLISTMWALFGFMLATLFRGTALAIGLGLVWALVIENLIGGLAFLLDFFKTLQKGLPGANAGALASSFGSAAQSQNGPPGIGPAVGATQSAITLVAYSAAFILISVVLVRRRDVT